MERLKQYSLNLDQIRAVWSVSSHTGRKVQDMSDQGPFDKIHAVKLHILVSSTSSKMVENLIVAQTTV